MGDLITSSDAAILLGVGPTAIKRWADSGVLRCVKTPGGHRRFDRLEIERILRAEHPAETACDWSAWIETLVNDGSVYEVHGRLFAERARRETWYAVASAMGELLGEIGDRWAAGRISVIQEHVASCAFQRGVASAAEAIPVSPAAPRCLLAAAEGDEHTLGLSLAELCLREAGWRTEWAGAHTRVADVVERVQTGAVQMVALSASESSRDAAVLSRQAGAMASACASAGVALALGGRGAWPDRPSYGKRFNDWRAFHLYALDRRGR
jgi:excisionase family DNA binding protein